MNNNKGFRYYYRIDSNTIQGRLTIGFLSIGFMAFCIAMVTNWQWKALFHETEQERTVLAPVQVYLLKVLRGIDNSVAAWNCQYINENDACEGKRQQIWTKEIAPALDSLSKLSAKIEGDTAQTDITLLKHTIRKLKTAQQNTASADSEPKEYFTNQLEPVIKDVYTLAETIEQKQRHRQLKVQASMEAFTDRLPYMLALSFLTAFIVSVLIGAILVTNVLARIRFIKYKIRELGQGNLPEQIPATKDELNSIISAINDLTGNLRQIQDFAGYVGKGDFKSTIKVFNDQGDLGISLAIMRDELSKVAEEDRKRNWTNEGLTKFSDILRIHGNELNKLAEHIISQLVKYLKANQGGFFIVNDTNPDDPYLELRACYAYDRKKFTQKQIMPGQGLVGQVWRERQTVYLKEVPDDYLQITSGLGDATPRFLLIVPLINDNVIAGVLEVASFHNLKDYQIAFVEQIANSIASSINNAKIVERTNVLLEDAQQMTAQMHAQEEMMRQNMEELQATQEEIIRGQKASRDREAHLTALINHTDYAASAIDCNFRLLACNMAMQKIYQRYNLSLQPGMQVLDAFESIYGKAEREKRRLIYNRVFAGEKYVDVEEAVVNGQTIHFAVHHTPIRTEDNKIIGLTIYAKNITEEKMKEQEYLRKEEELKKKLESITEENGKLLTEITKLHGNG